MEFARGKAIVTAVVGVEEGESGSGSEREWLWPGTVNGKFSFSCEVVVEAEERSGSGGDAHGMYNDGSFCKEMGMKEVAETEETALYVLLDCTNLEVWTEMFFRIKELLLRIIYYVLFSKISLLASWGWGGMVDDIDFDFFFFFCEQKGKNQDITEHLDELKLH